VPHPLNPEDIVKIEFHRSVGGYARDEVREFLDAVAELVRDLEERVESGYLNLGEKMGQLLQQAKDEAVDIVSVATEEAVKVGQEAKAAGERTRAEAKTAAADIVATAEEHGAKIVAEAEGRVDDLRKVEAQLRKGLSSLRSELDAVVARIRPLEQGPSEPGVSELGGPTEELQVETAELSDRLEDAGR
jgi:DivIVA domain-containing protein